MDYDMLESFKNINEPIKNIIIQKDEIYISLVKIIYDNFILHLIPEAECCSHSWIQEDDNFNKLIGKVIQSINEDNTIIYELPDDNDDSYDVVRNHLFKIKFKDTDEIFKFYLRNNSNGYYDGNLHITLQKID